MAIMLNNDMRDIIRTNAMNGVYVVQLREARKALFAVAQEVHAAAYAKIPFDKLPEEFLHRETDVRINLPRVKGKKQLQVVITGAFYHGCPSWYVARHKDDIDETETPTPLFIIPPQQHVINLDKYPVSKALQKKLIDAYNTLDELVNKRCKMDQNINAILASVRSVNQLLEAWPDCDRYLPLIAAAESKSLTIRVDDLNKELIASKHTR